MLRDERMPETRIDLLALSYSLDQICQDYSIEPQVVIRWLLDEGMIDLADYFENEEDELDDEME